MKSKNSSRYKTPLPKTILFTTDYEAFRQFENSCAENGWPSYIVAIKREQRFFKNLLKRKYHKTQPNNRFVFLVYIHTDFGQRTEKDYKLVLKYSKDYIKFKQTDDYSEECTLQEALDFFNSPIQPFALKS